MSIADDMKIFFSKHPASGQVAMMPAITALAAQGRIEILLEERDGREAAKTASMVVLSSSAEYSEYYTKGDTRTFYFVSRSSQTVHAGTEVGDLNRTTKLMLEQIEAAEARAK